MALTKSNADKARPLEAWAGTSPDKGVKTRRRSAKLETASSERRSLPCEPVGISSTTKNEVDFAQQDRIQETHQGGNEVLSLAKRRRPAATLRIRGARQRSYVTPEQQPYQIERAVTTREQNAASASTDGATFHQT